MWKDQNNREWSGECVCSPRILDEGSLHTGLVAKLSSGTLTLHRGCLIYLRCQGSIKTESVERSETRFELVSQDGQGAITGKSGLVLYVTIGLNLLVFKISTYARKIDLDVDTKRRQNLGVTDS